jgi:5'-deoxynucleotidase YfbR-like HD superfamily hydrolase
MSNLEASPHPQGGVLRTLEFVRRAAHVKRYHTEVVLKEQSVGEHTFNVIWLCYLLTKQHPTTALLMHAAAHDAAEHATGDIPSPTKRALGIRTQVDSFEAALMADAGLALPTLDDHSAHILKLADALDGVLYSLREHNLGNRLIDVVFRNYAMYVREELQSYRNRFGDVFGEGAEYVETTALEILLHAEGQFRSTGPHGAHPIGREHIADISLEITKGIKKGD